MTPLDYKSEVAKDFRNFFFRNVTTGVIVTAVCDFVFNINNLINGRISLFGLVEEVIGITVFTLCVASCIYVYLFPNDTSYKDSCWYKCVTLAKFNRRACLVAMLAN